MGTAMEIVEVEVTEVRKMMANGHPVCRRTSVIRFRKLMEQGFASSRTLVKGARNKETDAFFTIKRPGHRAAHLHYKNGSRKRMEHMWVREMYESQAYQ